MKKKLLVPGLLLLMGALSLSSCSSDDPANSQSGKGFIAPVFGVDTSFLGSEIISRAGEEERKVEDLSLTITKTDGTYEKTWPSVADFNPEDEFPIGDYTVEVAYGNQDDEGFDKKAAYYDSQNIKVYENESTPVSLNAARTHAMIMIRYTDAFEHYIQTAGVKVQTASGKTITFQYNDENPETRAALIVPGTTKVSIDMERYNGTWIRDYIIKSFETEARGHYTLTLDVNQSEVGNPMLQVVFDDNVGEPDVIDIDISDEVINAPAPQIILEGINPGETLTIVEGAYEGDPIRASIIAKGYIASVNMNVQSTVLEYATWKAATDDEGHDLIGISQNDIDTYTQNGLECHGIWNQPGRLAVIDFTKVLNGLKYLEADNKQNISTFTLNVTDRNNNSSENGAVSFSVKVLPIELSLLNPSYLSLDDTEMDLDLSFNGGDPTDKVTFKAKDFNGFVNVKADIRKKDKNLYSVHLSEMPTYYDSTKGNISTIQAEFEKKTYNLEVERHGVIADATDNNIFAKRALVTLSPINIDQSDIDNPKFTLKTSNKSLSFEKYAENIFIVKDLEPGQINDINITFDKPTIYCPLLNITTEEARQLPNSGMEDWSISAHGTYWNRYEPVKEGEVQYWDTMNGLTTSSRNGTDGTTYTYVANSGTSSTTDTKSGTGLAALIRTVGWGAGNTASANAFNQNSFGTCKNVTAGELYLGRWNSADSKSLGYGFASRPSKLSFWYKYSTVTNNGDFATAEIQVLDKNGKIISSQNIHLEAISSYTYCELTLNYNIDTEKAEKILVNFKSSGNENCLKAESKYMTPPPPLNLGTGEYVGSKLYIDDIELIYE